MRGDSMEFGANANCNPANTKASAFIQSSARLANWAAELSWGRSAMRKRRHASALRESRRAQGINSNCFAEFSAVFDLS